MLSARAVTTVQCPEWVRIPEVFQGSRLQLLRRRKNNSWFRKPITVWYVFLFLTKIYMGIFVDKEIKKWWNLWWKKVWKYLYYCFRETKCILYNSKVLKHFLCKFGRFTVTHAHFSFPLFLNCNKSLPIGLSVHLVKGNWKPNKIQNRRDHL